MKNVTTPDGVVHRFPDEATPEMMHTALAKYLTPLPSTDMQARAAVARSPMPVSTGNPVLPMINISPEQTGNMLPGLAAQAAQAFPPAVPFAAAGGAHVRNALMKPLGIPPIDPDAAGAMAGALQIPGEALQTFGPPIAERFMQTSLGRWSGQGLKAAKLAIQKQIGPGLRRLGTKQADKIVMEQGQKVNEVLQAAKRKGMWTDTPELVKGTDNMLSDPAMTEADKKLITKWNDELLEGKAEKVDPVSLDRMRQKYDNEGKAIHAIKQGEKTGQSHVGPTEKLRAQWAKNTADWHRQLLHDPVLTEPPVYGSSTPPTMRPNPNAVPGLKDIHEQQSAAITLRDAIKPLEFRGGRRLIPHAGTAGGATVGYFLPSHSKAERVGHAAALGYALSPYGLSQMSLLMSNPTLAPIISRLAQIGSGAMQQPGTASGPGTGQQP